MGNDKSKSCDKYKFFQIGKFSNHEVKNYENQLLLFRDLILEMAMNYLEIREMYSLARTCKLLYGYLFSDSNEFWRRVGERDGFLCNSGLECKQIYSNLWEKCLEFENDPHYTNDFESRGFAYFKAPSHSNYFTFTRFLRGINQDFNQMIYILRNEKKNVILRAYIAVYGLIINKDEEYKEGKLEQLPTISDKELFNERLEKVFRILCLKEDGVNFYYYDSSMEPEFCNLLSLVMDRNLDKLSKESTQRIEDLLLKTAVFRITKKSNQ